MTATESNSDKWRDELRKLMLQDPHWAEFSSESHPLGVMFGRPDYDAVLNFGTNGALYDAMRLFWGVYELWKDGRAHLRSVLPAEYEDLFLDWFEHLYHSYDVPYIPDVDDGLDNHDELFIYLHIAAARAFRIRNGNEMSEEVLDCLDEVVRTMTRLAATCGGPNHFFGEAPSNYTSAGAILAMVFVDLWRIRKEEGRYADALHYLSSAARYYDGAAANFYGGEGIDELWPEIAEEEHYWESRLPNLLTGLDISADDVIQTFQTIRSDEISYSDWAQVARDCRSIADSSARAWQFAGNTEQDYGPIHLWGDEDVATLDRILDELYELRDRRGIHLEITDEEWGPVTWSQFWHKAEAWARTQLSPSEYRKMREDDEQHAAETRLKNYFFDNSWSYLPERARGRLINADLIWNSPQRVSRESILNELLRATEEMCEQFVVQPLVNDSPYILCIEAKMAEKRRSLGVRDYINICEHPSMPSLLSERGLSDDESRFMTEDLPSSMRNLTRARNPAEHETGTSLIPPALVDSAYRLFLGIGRPGVLPQLARIGRKLQSHRR